MAHRLTPERARLVADGLGVRLSGLSPAGVGKGRTIFAVTDAGQPVVVKWLERWGQWLPGAIGHSAQLLGRGYPTARIIAHGPVLGGYGLVQDRLPGQPVVAGPDKAVLDEVCAAVALQSAALHHGAAPRSGDPGWMAKVVYGDTMGWWRTAREHSPEAAELCLRLAEWVRAVPRPEPRADFVHFDLDFTNILVRRGRLGGIVDIDNLALGDRALDLVCMAFQYEGLRFRGEPVPGPGDPVDRLVEEVLRISGRSGWRQAVAYMGITQLGWVGPQGQRDQVERSLWVIPRMMDRAG
jgi:hypothetical protein